MINMAFMPLYMWEMWDVTPVTNTRTHEQWKVVQYSVWAESAINSKISRRYDTKTGAIYHNTIISRFSKPIDCVLCISHAQRLDLPHLLLRISSGISVEMNWACFECSSPARLFHLWGWLVPISRHIPNLKHIKIIWNIPLQLKILLKSARFAYNDRTPPVGKAGGGDRWPLNRSQFGYWTCKINLWVDSVELNRCYTMNGKIL